MAKIVYKKIKMSPHSRDRLSLFARDYDKDEYVKYCVYDPSAFINKAYPENAEKYAYFLFNQNPSEIELAHKQLQEIKAKEKKQELQYSQQLKDNPVKSPKIKMSDVHFDK